MTNKLYLFHIPCAEKGRMKINSSNESREKPVSVCLKKKKCFFFVVVVFFKNRLFNK